MEIDSRDYWGSATVSSRVGNPVKALQSCRTCSVFKCTGKCQQLLRVNMKKDVADFISTLFHSSTVTHFMHLSTDSYATHKALGKYYPAIVELADSYAEAYSGCYEKIKDFPENFHNAKDPQKYLASIKTYVEKNRDALPDDSQLQNIVDEIAALIDSTIYLLSFK